MTKHDPAKLLALIHHPRHYITTNKIYPSNTQKGSPAFSYKQLIWTRAIETLQWPKWNNPSKPEQDILYIAAV